MAIEVNKEVLANGEGEIKIKDGSKEVVYKYLVIPEAQGIIAASGVSLAAAGDEDSDKKDEKDKKDDKLKESNDPKELTNLMSNLESYSEYYGYCEALKARIEKEKLDLQKIGKKEHPLHDVFYDKQDKLRDGVLNIAPLKKEADIKTEATKASKKFDKAVDEATREVFDGIKNDKDDWKKYLGTEFMDRWGGGKGNYGFKFLGMKIKPQKYLKAKVKDLAQNGINKLENCEWNILTIGPKLLLKAYKLGSLVAAWAAGKNTVRKQAEKIKKQEVKKSIDKTIKEFEKVKKEHGVPTKDNINDEDFKDLNQMVKNTFQNECLVYILKWAYKLEVMAVDDNEFGEIKEKKLTIKNSENGNISKVQDYNNMEGEAIDLFINLYEKVIKQADVWKKMPVCEKMNPACKIGADPDFINFFKNVKFTGNNDQMNNESASNINKIYDEYTKFFTVDKCKFSLEKYYNEIKKFKSKASSIQVALINEGEIDTEESKINNVPACIANDGSVGGEEKVDTFDKEAWIAILDNSKAPEVQGEDDKKTVTSFTVINKDKKEVETLPASDSSELAKNKLCKQIIATNEKFPEVYQKFKEAKKDDKEKAGVIFYLDSLFKAENDEESDDENTIFGQEFTEFLKTCKVENDKITSTYKDDSIELGEKDLEKLKEMIENTKKEDFEKYEQSVKDNEEELKKLSSIKKICGVEEKEEAPADVKQKVDAAAKELVALGDNTDNNNFDKFIEKTKNDVKSAEEAVTNWLADHPDREKEYNNAVQKIGEEHAKQIIPALWLGNTMLKLKELVGESIKRKQLLQLLNEKFDLSSLENATKHENGVANWKAAYIGQNAKHKDEAEKLKKDKPDEYEAIMKKLEELEGQNNEGESESDINIEELNKKVQFLINDSVEKLLQIEAGKYDNFKTEYENFVKNTNSIIEEIMKSKNEEITKKMTEYKDKDPLEQVGGCLQILKSLSEKNDEKSKETNTEANSGTDTENNTNNSTEEKPTENASFKRSFQNYLKESLK